MPTLYFLAAANQYFAISINDNITIAERSTQEGWITATKFPTFIHPIEYTELPIDLQLEPSLLEDLLKITPDHLQHPKAREIPGILEAYLNGDRYIGRESTELLTLNLAQELYLTPPREIRLAG